VVSYYIIIIYSEKKMLSIRWDRRNWGEVYGIKGGGSPEEVREPLH
jgi:hypothetical protein